MNKELCPGGYSKLWKEQEIMSPGFSAEGPWTLSHLSLFFSKMNVYFLTGCTCFRCLGYDRITNSNRLSRRGSSSLRSLGITLTLGSVWPKNLNKALHRTVVAPFSSTTWWSLVWLTLSSPLAVSAERAPTAFFTNIHVCLSASHCSGMILCYSVD